MDLKIKKGLEINLPQQLDKDTFYVTTDTKKVRLNDCVWEDSENIKEDIMENIKPNLVPILHSELLQLLNDNNLSPGCFYRITDHVTTTTQTTCHT